MYDMATYRQVGRSVYDCRLTPPSTQLRLTTIRPESEALLEADE
jgi:hypothetical protein